MVILDLFYDLFNIDIPTVYDSFQSALKSTGKSIEIIHFEFIVLDPVWNLTSVDEEYSYVASEGIAKVARLSSTRFGLI